MGILKYSNGWGHLIMSVFFGLIGIVLVVYPGLDPTTKGVGISLILTISGAWFIPSAAKQMASAIQQAPDPPSTLPVIGGSANGTSTPAKP